MTQISENEVLVKVKIQAPSDEIKDLVAVVIGKLENIGLVLAKKNPSHLYDSIRNNTNEINLDLRIADWLK